MDRQFYGTRRHVVFVRDRGRVTIPAAVRERYGLEKGTALILAEAEDRLVLFVSHEEYVEAVLDRIGSALKEQGLTVEDVLEEREEGGYLEPLRH
jgi:AbrB family looped-hinge helix DNA binding protein